MNNHVKPIFLDSPEVRHVLEEKLDELAREYHETHDPKVKRQIESLSKRLAMSPRTEEDDSDCE